MIYDSLIVANLQILEKIYLTQTFWSFLNGFCTVLSVIIYISISLKHETNVYIYIIHKYTHIYFKKLIIFEKQWLISGR